MKPINKQVLKDAAKKLLFDMEEEQYDTLLKEFDFVLEHISILESIPNIDDVEPMVFPYDITTTYLREDVANEPLPRDLALQNTEDVVDGQVSLPRVIKK